MERARRVAPPLAPEDAGGLTVFMGSAFRSMGDRLLAIAFVLMLGLIGVGMTAGQTTASFTGTSTNPSNTTVTMQVQPPAGQNATVSAANGVVQLSWTATPTAPGTGHTLTYLILRGPVGGPYSQIASTSALTYNDTPAADGSYGYVIEAQVTGGGSFVSGNSAAQTGLSDRTAPTKSITCNAAACSAGWYTATVSVTVSGTDAGSGMGSVTRNVDAGGQTSTGGASATFNVSGDNAGHTVQYFTTDAAGNVSSTATQTIKIDGTAPTNAGSFATTTPGGGNPSGTVNATWTAGSDALSGLAGYTIHRSGVVASCPAATPANYPNTYAVGVVTSTQLTGMVSGSKYCFYITANDNAGNSSAASAASGPTKAH